jgi:hypothetical protein
VFFIGCTTKEKCTAKILFLFALRFLHCSQQSIFLPFHTPNKPNIIICKKNFAMRFNSGARQTQVFAMRFSSTHGNT